METVLNARISLGIPKSSTKPPTPMATRSKIRRRLLGALPVVIGRSAEIAGFSTDGVVDCSVSTGDRQVSVK